SRRFRLSYQNRDWTLSSGPVPFHGDGTYVGRLAMNIETVFAAAAQKAQSERAAFLDEACGADAELRRKVERLLKVHDVAGDFLESPAHTPFATAEYVPIAEKPGSMVGPYKLLQEIGQGGFGVVYMAEQEKPVRRMVALKIIKPGMD